jgi:hypothetical protein
VVSPIQALATRALPLLVVALAAAPVDADAQGHDHGGGSTGPRLTEDYRWGDPEGRLMAYYSAALTFSPVGAPSLAATAWTAMVGLELGYVPPLSEAQRTAGFSKTESTNLLSVFPRPRLVATLPAGLALEASWIPPVRVTGVKANLISAAVSRPISLGRGLVLTPRVAGMTGSVRAPVTCNDDLALRSEGDALFFTHVCHGVESDDSFEPTALSGELVLGGTPDGHGITPYAGGGVRVERDRFDVGVRFSDGTFDPNHPILELDLTRAYGFVCATWSAPMSAFSTELFYAPRSLLTARVQVSLRLVGGR